jgi:hypothetical protein
VDQYPQNANGISSNSPGLPRQPGGKNATKSSNPKGVEVRPSEGFNPDGLETLSRPF